MSNTDIFSRLLSKAEIKEQEEKAKAIKWARRYGLSHAKALSAVQEFKKIKKQKINAGVPKCTAKLEATSEALRAVRGNSMSVRIRTGKRWTHGFG